ncbi:hypothetical protein, partial [Streptococcus suis]|uniref:hypothetical protein n=1 Tax=Streptococcus suis TaxID=1307 RepID=UPI001C2E66EF
MQTVDTTAFVYFPSKFHVRINVRFHSISANKKSPANAGLKILFYIAPHFCGLAIFTNLNRHPTTNT